MMKINVKVLGELRRKIKKMLEFKYSVLQIKFGYVFYLLVVLKHFYGNNAVIIQCINRK